MSWAADPLTVLHNTGCIAVIHDIHSFRRRVLPDHRRLMEMAWIIRHQVFFQRRNPGGRLLPHTTCSWWLGRGATKPHIATSVTFMQNVSLWGLLGTHDEYRHRRPHDFCVCLSLAFNRPRNLLHCGPALAQHTIHPAGCQYDRCY